MNVLRCNNAKIRDLIERFTLENCKPHCIVFVQDGNGDWITNIENLKNIRLITDKENLKTFLSDNGIQKNVRNIKEVLTDYCEVIPYVKPKLSDYEVL